MKTEVVNLYNGDDYDVFIGRDGNIFECPHDIRALQIGREEMIIQYRQHVESHPDIIEACRELKGLRLGCFCAPDKCHGDVLAEIADTRFPDEPDHERWTRLTTEGEPQHESWEQIMAETKPLPPAKRIWELP